MKVYYDLHIHSALSPCADDAMRPGDIARMAKLKGLDIISIVDHVCGKNIRVSKKVAEKNGLLFLPGIEITANNGAHLLGYFTDVEKAVEFSDIIYNSLEESENTFAYFGNQYIIDGRDEVCGEAKKILSGHTPFSVWEVIGLAGEYGGIIVPAHINREYQGILAIEGSRIKEYNFNAVEVRKNLSMNYDIIKGSKVVYNSDAHILSVISERENYIELKEKSVEAVFEYLLK